MGRLGWELICFVQNHQNNKAKIKAQAAARATMCEVGRPALGEGFFRKRCRAGTLQMMGMAAAPMTRMGVQKLRTRLAITDVMRRSAAAQQLFSQFLLPKLQNKPRTLKTSESDLLCLTFSGSEVSLLFFFGWGVGRVAAKNTCVVGGWGKRLHGRFGLGCSVAVASTRSDGAFFFFLFLANAKPQPDTPKTCVKP